MTCPAILFAVQQRNLDVWVCLYIPCSLSFLRFHEQHTPSLTFTLGQIVSALVQAGADPALPLQLGWGYLAEATPLIVALMDNDPAATNLLLHASSEVGPPSVLTACSQTPRCDTICTSRSSHLDPHLALSVR